MGQRKQLPLNSNVRWCNYWRVGAVPAPGLPDKMRCQHPARTRQDLFADPQPARVWALIIPHGVIVSSDLQLCNPPWTPASYVIVRTSFVGIDFKALQEHT